MSVPPRWEVATRLLALCLPREDVDAIVGDLEEEHAARMRSGLRSARWYWGQVVRSMPLFLWLPVERGGWRSTLAVALAACALQAAIELTAGFAAYEWTPPDAQWPTTLTLVVTLPSLTLLSYKATLIRPGASTAFAAVGTLAIGVRLVLAAVAGRELPFGTIAALVVVPVLVTGGGFFALRRSHD